MPGPIVSGGFNFCVAADHPSLAGHFPGNPIVPGVLILDEVVTAWNGAHPDEPVIGIADAKFLAPLRPGIGVSVQFARLETRVAFNCQVETQTIARGALRIASQESPDD